MKPYTISVFDSSKNSSNKYSADNESHEDLFLTNIKYLFDDDNDLNIEELRLSDSENEIEHVIVLEINVDSTISDIEVVSDRFQLIDFKLESENDIRLNVLSEFSSEIEDKDTISLEKLIYEYKVRNRHLYKLISDLKNENTIP